MTNPCCDALQLMDVVWADTTSILEGIDTTLLDITPQSTETEEGAAQST
jgi:hypothetical protein